MKKEITNNVLNILFRHSLHAMRRMRVMASSCSCLLRRHSLYVFCGTFVFSCRFRLENYIWSTIVPSYAATETNILFLARALGWLDRSIVRISNGYRKDVEKWQKNMILPFEFRDWSRIQLAPIDNAVNKSNAFTDVSLCVYGRVEVYFLWVFDLWKKYGEKKSGSKHAWIIWIGQ